MPMDTQTFNLVVGLIIAALVVIGLVLLYRRKHSQTLEQRFGPEYERTVQELGSRAKAETELERRQRRVEKLRIVPLDPAEAERFAQDWKSLQARFVDNPKGSLAEADLLVREVMQRRGYPMADFGRSAADISVHHPQVVEHYRAAHTIALLDERGEADTEQIRQAIVHYRALFSQLLEVQSPPSQQPPQPKTQRERDMETQS